MLNVKKKNEKKERCSKRPSKRLSKRPLKRSLKRGEGMIDTMIDKLPFEVHIPSYQYCGPGTHLQKRLNRGDLGINPLDKACKVHDIAYDKHKDSSERSIADKVLQKEAMKRVFAKDASLSERTAALGVAAMMKAKRKFTGKGLIHEMKQEGTSLASVIKNAKVAIKKTKPDNIESAIKVAVASVRKYKKGKCIKTPRTIKIPTHTGGVLPLIPIFAGLSALGAIGGSAASIVSAINQAKRGQRELEENQRHHKTMEAITIARKSGKGLYLHVNKKGDGFYLKTFSKNR